MNTPKKKAKATPRDGFKDLRSKKNPKGGSSGGDRPMESLKPQWIE
jgi:hypothetical protein